MANIIGRPRNELLVGTAGNDYIDGKGGSDLMRDTFTSNDTYYFGVGYGQPNITDLGGNDTLLFGPGIKASDIKFYLTKHGYLMPRVKDTTDKPEITFWPDPRYQIERWVFSDGTVLTNKDVSNRIDYSTRVIIGTGGWDKMKVGGTKNLIYLMQGNDYLSTYTNGSNIIEPSKGDDKIFNYGYSNDEVYASPGTDYIEDLHGNDRYIYNRGDGKDIIYDKQGKDTVKFGRGIVKSELVFKIEGYDLAITFRNSSGDKLNIRNWTLTSENRIEDFEFWDNTHLSSTDINKRIGLTTTTSTLSTATAKVMMALAAPVSVSQDIVPTITGTDSYNSISTGNSGDDVYYLKKGNDRVMDYTGNDTYIFNKGDGRDNIGDQAGSDVIAFGSGITKDDISFQKQDLDLVMSIKGTTDSINVNKWYRNANYQIEKVQFQDGTYISNTEINQIIQQVASYSAGSDTQIASTDASASNQQDITLVSA